MAVHGAVYRCQRCGQEVRVDIGGLGVLVCCNVPMERKGEPEGGGPGASQQPGTHGSRLGDGDAQDIE